MKKIVNSALFRYVAITFAVIIGSLSVVSAVGVCMAIGAGVYSNDLDSSVKNGQKNLQALYSRHIFYEVVKEDKPGYMEDSNLSYIIVNGINPDEDIYSEKNRSIINDPANIIYTNNENYKLGKMPNEFSNYSIFYKEEAKRYENINLIRSLFYGGYQHYRVDGYTSYTEEVKDIFYNDGIFYLETENYAFPATELLITASALDKDTYKKIEDTGWLADGSEIIFFSLQYDSISKTFYYVADSFDEIVLDTSKYKKWSEITINEYETKSPKSIKDRRPSKGVEIYEWQGDDSEYNYSFYIDGNGSLNLHYMVDYNVKDESYSNVYAVLSEVNSPLNSNADDLFADQKELITFLFEMRYALIIMMAVFAIAFLVLLAFVCYSKYLSSDNDSVRANLFHRIPFGIYMAIAFGIFMAIAAFGVYCVEEILYAEITSDMLVFAVAGMTLLVITDMYILTVFFIEILCRIGAGMFWKSTLLYIIYKFFKNICKKIKGIYHEASKNLSLFLKAAFILMIINMAILVVCIFTASMTYMGSAALFIISMGLLICVLLDATVMKAVFQMETLQKHAKMMADGNLESKVDTSKMFWEFKKHGNYLNKIGEGMTIAVNERMKSEHFKTELITNVSHDIKTPLTSIINYVDLLKKENISQPKAVEYIDVLERQSARLKKLIEDLMDASKASTGNLTVNSEMCDINILLTQALGEFEDKMHDAGLELIINKNDENIFIMADNRHIWRIFDNLMNNICKYGQQGTRVYINFVINNGTVDIIFRNTSKYQLNISSDELMERFVRGDASRHTEGNGLGLSIAKNLAEIMGGTLKLYVDGDLFKVVVTFPVEKV